MASIAAEFCPNQRISRHLMCAICQDVFRNPMRAPCGHSFCLSCIDEWLKMNNSCPTDRSRLIKSMMHRDIPIAAIIDELLVFCPYRKHGCGFQDQLEKMISHRSSCAFNTDKLPEAIQRHLIRESIEEPSISVGSSPSASPIAPVPSLVFRLFQNATMGSTIRSTLTDLFTSQSQPISASLNQPETIENREDAQTNTTRRTKRSNGRARGPADITNTPQPVQRRTRTRGARSTVEVEPEEEEGLVTVFQSPQHPDFMTPPQRRTKRSKTARTAVASNQPATTIVVDSPNLSLWSCSTCTYINSDSVTTCEICSAAKTEGF